MNILKRRDPVAGAIWMLISCCLIAGVATLGRYAAVNGVPPLQVVFLRLVFGLITMLPLLAWRGREFYQTENTRMYITRSIIGLCAMVSWFVALAYVPVGKMTAISFLAPLFATVFAVVLLKEVVRIRRWMATLVGFAGALVILRPGLEEMSIGVWLAVFSATCMGLSFTWIKRLTGRDDPDKVVFISSLMMTPVMVLPALYVWEWPEPYVWPWLLAFGPVATLGHVSLTRALRATDASQVMGLDFARLPFAVVYGWLLFGEVIDFWTWVGAAIIFAAGFYITRREAQLRKAPKPTVADV